MDGIMDRNEYFQLKNQLISGGADSTRSHSIRDCYSSNLLL